MAQAIRYYKDETRCTNCGRFIKNVVEVDGVQYGIKCCDGFIDSKPVVNKIKKTDFAQLVATQKREDLKAERDALLDYAIAVLPANPISGGMSAFFNQPTARLETFLTKYSHMPVALGVIAILQSRLIKH